MATATKTRTATVETIEVTVDDLGVGDLVKHKGEWVPVRRIVPSEEWDEQFIIVTTKGTLSVSFGFEAIDIAVTAS